MIDAFLLVAWRVWFAHNEVTHAKPLPSIEGSKRFLCSYLNIIKNIKDMSTDSILKGKGALVQCNPIADQPLNLPGKLWTKPPHGWVKLNCDGSVKLQDGSAGAGMVLRDDEGHIVFCACSHLLACDDPIEAEAKACEEGLL